MKHSNKGKDAFNKNRKASNVLLFVKKYGLRIWIIVIAISMTALIVYASYPGLQNKAKKVISTSADTQMRFSSNYMEDGTTKVKTVALSSSNPSLSVSVRNFSKNNPTLWYGSNVSYILTAELTNTSGILSSDANYNAVITSLIGDKNLTISLGSVVKTLNSSNTNCSFSETLQYSRNDSDRDDYIVTFPDVETGVCIRLTATPTPESNYPDLKSISVILAVSDKDKLSSEGWEGSFNDSQSNNKTPGDYDAYNYVLTGYGDSTTATFSWNSSKLEINRKYFTDELEANLASGITQTIDSETGDTWKTVTIKLDSEKSKGRYNFQLFRVYDENSSIQVGFSNWSDLDVCVRFDDGI